MFRLFAGLPSGALDGHPHGVAGRVSVTIDYGQLEFNPVAVVQGAAVGHVLALGTVNVARAADASLRKPPAPALAMGADVEIGAQALPSLYRRRTAARAC